LLTDIWLPMFKKRKRIINARSEDTGVLSATHFQIATKLARAFENKDRLVLYALHCIIVEWSGGIVGCDRF
jgi:hypothetical protein